MDRLHYAGHSVVTGTAIAHAVLDYAQALASAGAAATIQIPIVNDDGTRGRSEILVGPSSQLMSDAEDSYFEEVTDHDLVARLASEAKSVRAHGVPTAIVEVPETGPVPVRDDFDF